MRKVSTVTLTEDEALRHLTVRINRSYMDISIAIPNLPLWEYVCISSFLLVVILQITAGPPLLQLRRRFPSNLYLSPEDENVERILDQRKNPLLYIKNNSVCSIP